MELTAASSVKMQVVALPAAPAQADEASPSVRDEDAGDDMEKRLSDALESDFDDPPEQVPGFRPSLSLGQSVSSGSSLGQEEVEPGHGVQIGEAQVTVFEVFEAQRSFLAAEEARA